MSVPPYEPPPGDPRQPGYGGAPYGQGPRPEDTVWSVLAHLSIFVFALLGPLVLYLVFKDTSPMTRHHAAEALNFHLTLLIASIVATVLVVVLIGFVLLLALFVYSIVLAIVAAVAAGNRQPYRYPLTIRFVS